MKAIVIDDQFAQFSFPLTTARDANIFFSGLPSSLKKRVRAALDKYAETSWWGRMATWNGITEGEDYGNGPYLPQDIFYMFPDGSVAGVIWNNNGKISIGYDARTDKASKEAQAFYKEKLEADLKKKNEQWNLRCAEFSLREERKRWIREAKFRNTKKKMKESGISVPDSFIQEMID